MSTPNPYRGQRFEVRGIQGADGQYPDSNAYVEIVSVSITGKICFKIFRDDDTPADRLRGGLHDIPLERFALLRSHGLWCSNSLRWPHLLVNGVDLCLIHGAPVGECLNQGLGCQSMAEDRSRVEHETYVEPYEGGTWIAACRTCPLDGTYGSESEAQAAAKEHHDSYSDGQPG